jgi:hypothetical protein
MTEATNPESPNPTAQGNFQPGSIIVSGEGHTVSVQQGATTQVLSVYQQLMSKHGAWYWIFHGIVALIVVAIWEYRFALLHLVRIGADH